MKPMFLALLSAVAAFGMAETFSASASAATPTQIETNIFTYLEHRDPSFSISIPTADYKSVQHMLDAALSRDDYLAHDYSGISYTGTSYPLTGKTQLRFAVQYRENRSEYAYVQKRVADILAHIIKPSMSDLMKEKAIHDYIVLHTAYDVTLKLNTPYDALTQGKTVCNGYAMLTYLMLRHVGIPCKMVDGEAGGAAHSWVLVKIGGHWYNLDTTWDDPVPDQPGKVRYDYFNLTDAQMAVDHAWKKAHLPTANTDFVSVLESGSQRNTAAGRQDAQFLKSTGLYVEEPQYTFQNPVQLVDALNRASSSEFVCRFPAAAVALLSTLEVTQPLSMEYTKDHRDPQYDIVTIQIG